MRRKSLLRLSCAGAAAVTLAGLAPGWAAGQRQSGRVAFNAPVKITPANGGGYEPGIISDRFGNLYATAHKENWQLALGPDGRSATQSRSMSWEWWSSDGGKTWKNLPLGPGDAQNHEFGDEGDMATDDANNLYFVDTSVADITLTSWHIGNSGPEFRFNTPLVGTAEPLDDRPWVTAHLDGHVFYFGNEGNKSQYPLGSHSAGPGSGPGRYTVFRSTDGGQTFDHTGITLNDSGWCRPAAAPNSPYVYAVCTNDNGVLYSYVSADDGKTWNRYTIGSYNGADSWSSYPTVDVAKDGSLWASYLDGIGSGTPTGAHFRVMHSTDHGKTWKTYDATPAGAAAKWQYRYSWLGIAPNGKTLGFGVFARPYDASKGPDAQPAPWRVYGAVFKAGQHPTLVSLDEKNPVTPPGFSSPPGDFLMAHFDPRSKLHVAWTRIVTSADAPQPVGHVTTVFRDIYTAVQK